MNASLDGQDPRMMTQSAAGPTRPLHRRVLAAAREIARLTLQEPRIERVVLGAMQENEPVREVWGRITAVVLAAGESKRMGQTKQVLPWRNTTVLGQVLQNLQASSIHDILVVSGHDAEDVEAVALWLILL